MESCVANGRIEYQQHWGCDYCTISNVYHMGRLRMSCRAFLILRILILKSEI